MYKTIDLCAGIGGIRKGFELTGKFKNVLSAEIDISAAKTYEHLFGDNPLNDLTTEEFKELAVNTDYDVLLAGFPCQSFSRIGKQLGFRDTTRGTIFFDIADIISRTTPRAVFLENVDNLVYHDHGNTIETIIRTLEDELDYRVIGVNLDENGNYEYSHSSLVRNTKDFGLPQNRPRTYIMAFSKKKYGRAIRLLTSQLPESGREIIYRDIFGVLENEVDDKYYMSQGYLETLKKHRKRNHDKGNGFGYCVVNNLQEEHPIANTILAVGGSGKERNLIFQPKDGVAGKLIKGKKSAINSEGIRVMTPTEWGRLQGFIGYAFVDQNHKETFSFPDDMTDAQKYKQFGNSVSIPVIKSMAEFMLNCFSMLEKQQEDVINALADNNEYFTKRQVMELLDLKSAQADILLKSQIDNCRIRGVKSGRLIRYVKFQDEINLTPFSYEEKVLSLASDHVFNNIEVCELLKITTDHANVLLSGLVKKKLLKRVSRGKYTLADHDN